MLNPGALVPFGAMRLGPDTTFVNASGANLWWPRDHYAGYVWNDTHIVAFSLAHVQGAGMKDYGNFGFTVARGTPTAGWIANASTPGAAAYKSAFSHGEEAASPGFYSAYLSDAATRANVTVSGTHSGMLVFECANGTSPADYPCVLVVDICHVTHQGGCPWANISVAPADASYGLPPGTLLVTGSTRDNGDFASIAGGIMMHMAAFVTVDAGVASTILWEGNDLLGANVTTVPATTSGGLGVLVQAAAPAVAGDSVTFTVRTGISWIDPQHAVDNLAAQQRDPAYEGPWLDFTGALAQTQAAWRQALSVVNISISDDTPPLLPERANRTTAFCPPASLSFVYEVAFGTWMLAEEWPVWSARHGLPLDASTQDIVQYVHDLSCYQAQAAASGADLATVFYTALFHAMSAPTTYSEHDRAYVGFDGAVHTVTWPSGAWMSDLSLWDTHRTQAPLLNVLAPIAGANVMQSILAMAEQSGGQLPYWAFASLNANIMCGTHALAVLADALLKHVPGSADSAGRMFNASYASIEARDTVASNYSSLGYIPLEEGHGYCKPASLTLDYAFDDACGAVLAAAAGQTGNASAWTARSRNYRNLWDAASATLCPRSADGAFYCDPDFVSTPHPFNLYYTEGNNLQYQWLAAHDIPGLVALFPNATAFVDALTAVMAGASAWPLGNFMPNPAFWSGNEPSLLLPWLFAFAGNEHAWRTQYWVRWSLQSYYFNRFDGMPGNDDYGTMASWAAWAMMGMYPVAGTDRYVLNGPIFPQLDVGIPSTPGAVLSIVGYNASAATPYVQAAALNGVALTSPIVTHSQLFSTNGTQRVLLEFWMGDQPLPWPSAS